MSILSDFEDRLADAVEGLFAGAFRSPVQPVELAKALAKAMDDGRAVGVGKIYAPTSFTVALSREDRRNLGEFTATLEGELATYLADHAREAGYTLTAKPRVRFDVHNDLKLGRFRVSADLAAAAEASEADEAPAHAEGAPAAHAAPIAAAGAAAPVAAAPGAQAPLAPRPRGVATLSLGDHDVALGGERLVIGRLRDCDICLPDVNVSRQHAELVQAQGGWTLRDLGSTNGTRVNGRPITEAPLRDGDVIEAGASRLIFHEARSGA